MATYQSVQSGSGNNGSVTITKPTSLAVGDLMLAGILCESGGANTLSPTTPADWTAIGSVNSLDDCTLTVYYKVATAGDVAASDFTFTTGGGFNNGQSIGHILRFTSPGLVAGSAGSGTSISNTTLTFTGFTPTRASCTYIMFAAKSSTIQQGTFGTYAIATSNPTWTERAETTYGNGTGSYDSVLAVATASRPEATATGDVTITNSAADLALYLGYVVAISPQVNGSVTPTTKIAAYAFTHVQSVSLEAVAEDPATDIKNPTVWTTQTKSSTTWTNETK
jgi:hypothetical protein